MYFLCVYIAAFWLKASSVHLDYDVYEGMEIGVSEAFKWNIIFKRTLSFCLNSCIDIRTGKQVKDRERENKRERTEMGRDNNTPIFIFIIMIVYVLSEIKKKTKRK